MEYDLTKDEDIFKLAKKISKEVTKIKIKIIDEQVGDLTPEMLVRLMMIIDTITFTDVMKAFVSCFIVSEYDKKDIKTKKDYINTLLNKMKEEILVTIKNPETIQ